ncbi:cation channel sperm-associated protein 2-like [Anneissia japonica]|uniref:cation channel sperm-associated protein 2-like n=1 Tax=Anneissia japonica TaxID=1529436 RepID=UPI00142557D8|nr:cation channel sperm-associated protein 2-like [Anneissia japonica]
MTDEQSARMSHLYQEISPKAELFRSKLIEDFHLLESFDEQGLVDAPVHYSKDIADKDFLNKVMMDNANELIKFQVYSSKDKSQIKMSDRRKNRVINKNAKNPPLDMWAHFVLESSLFQNFMLLLILTNSIALGVQSEVSGNTNPELDGLRFALEIFDYCSLILFMMEIILKWIDCFWTFWGNGWNIFDFIVTVGSFVPELIAFTAGDLKEVRVIVNNLRVFRILRSLKMVSRFRQVRLIALAITKAFNAMTFIMLLLFTFAYIFAIAGVIFFDNYSRSDREDLIYKNSFSNLGRALITLFQLFTLDQWHKVLTDIWKVSDKLFTTFYIILWICIGSFIFRNIFVGIMVNNFQNIRNDLFDEVREHETTRKMIMDAEKFSEELNKHDMGLIKARRGSEMPSATNAGGGLIPSDVNAKNQKTSSGFKNQSDLMKSISHRLMDTQQKSNNWEKMVHDNLEILSRTPTETLWPRDTLFRYLQQMEALQENLEERQDLQNLAYHALLQIFDTQHKDH